jgi:hypothetical protein
VLKSSELASSADEEGGGADLPGAEVPVFAGAPAPVTGLPFCAAIFSSGLCERVPLFFRKKEKTTARSPGIDWEALPLGFYHTCAKLSKRASRRLRTCRSGL